MRRKIFVIFFLMGKTLFSQSFDENFLSPKYQRNNIIKKTEEKYRKTEKMHRDIILEDQVQRKAVL